MAATIRQLAELVRGNLFGDGEQVVHAARTLQDAEPGDISFVENPKNASQVQVSKASAVLVPKSVPFLGKTVIQVADPLMAFVAVFQHLQGKAPYRPVGIDPRADVHPSVQVGEEPSIHSFASIGAGTIIGKRCRIHSGVVVGENCRIGDDAILYPNVVLYEDVVLGDRVILHANCVIGADGFGYRFQQGRHVKVPQLSHVIIGSDVEIGASSCVDRGVFEPTRIGDGTKLDNFVQIAHNCQIGKHNAFAAQVGIGGSTTTGDYVFMGGQAGVRDHIHIGDRVMLGAKTGVFYDVPAGKKMFLYPAQDDREGARIIACWKRLPAMRKDLLRVLKALDLEATSDQQPVRTAEAPAA